jgi:hypothetical protein
MSDDNVPTTEGFYWAAQERYQWFNLIVYVAGTPPFMYIKDFIDRAGATPHLVGLKPSDISRWGPRIPYLEPELEEKANASQAR